MKIVFFGTPDYVLPLITSLHKKFVTGPGKSPIVAVVTQPPKPTGRKQYLTYSAIDRWAHDHKVPTFYSSAELLENGTDADIGILASYNEIIPKEVLDMFPQGILNVHPSLLPKLRGASPIQGAIITDGTKTGVTIMKMDDKLDHGPVVTQFKAEIEPADTGETLRARLFEKAADVLVELMEPYIKGKVLPKTQEHEDATFTTKILKQDGFIPPENLKPLLGELSDKSGKPWEMNFIKGYELNYDAATVERFIRALKPWPNAWTYVRLTGKLVAGKEDGQQRRLKLLSAHVEGEKLVLDTVQLEGKNEVSWKQFKDAYSVEF